MTTHLHPGIADFHDGPAMEDPWAEGAPPLESLRIVVSDPAWPTRAADLIADIRAALGPSAWAIEHVGSTAVPGLPSKDVIDLDLIVEHPADEASYVQALVALGYHLTVREPAFEEHRMLRLDEPRVNLHVYGPDSAEAARHRFFRDWLRQTPSDVELYAEAKRVASIDEPQSAMDYNERKAATVREIHARAFAANGVSLRARALAPTQLPELPTSLGDTIISWRPVSPSDAAVLFALHMAAGKVDHPRDLHTLELIEMGMSGERFELTTDAVIAFSVSGEPVAYGGAKLGNEWDTDIEVHLDGVVHPDWRGRGIGRTLLAWQEARGRQLLADCGADLPALITTGAREACTDAVGLYAEAGFLPVRWWRELRRPLTEPVSERPLPEGVTMRAFSEEFSELTRVAMNDAFRDHWGSSPTTQREWNDEHALVSFAPELSRLAVTGTGTETDPMRVVAAVLSEVNPAEWELNGGPFGYLATIGVVRDWRGKGLSSALIAATLTAYQGEGFENAILDVDAKNPSGAFAMYERLGFVEQDRSITFAKYA